MIKALMFPALLLIASAAVAAPTCLDKNGDTIRCGTPGAMPVGWTLSPDKAIERDLFQPPGPSFTELLEVFCTLALFLAVIAAMPDFDGSRAGDWDKQEYDDGEGS